jgi:hypothetical protein
MENSMDKPLPTTKRRFFTKENIWLLLLSYVLTIAISRLVIYFSCIVYRFYCGSVINGVHYHHYAWGFVLVLLGLLLYRRYRDLLSVVLIGIGNGFIFDELIMVFWGEEPIGYTSPWNIIPIALGLVLLNVVFLLVHQGMGINPKEFDSEYLTKHLGGVARFGEKIFFSKIGPIKKDRYAITKFGYFATMVLFILLILFILYASENRLRVV